MPKLTEFYPELQGRPESKVALDMETRLPSIPYGYISDLVNALLEEAMKEELNKLISRVEELIIEVKRSNLHLASVTEEDVEDSGVEDD